MSCEKLQSALENIVTELPSGEADSDSLNELLVRLIFWCQNRTHTSRIASSRPSDEIPDFLRKNPDSALLEKHKIADASGKVLVVK